MAEPIPSAGDGDDQRLPANAEDRKAAAALSSLNNNEISQGDDAGSKLSSAAAQEALGKAMSRLEIAAGGGANKTTATATPSTGTAGQKEEVVKKKAVKIAAEDVTLLVDELDLTKNKATELLKLHDGDVKQALRAFITPAAAAA
ncbi:uncharacterized protein TRUGW13939_00745 [Talaromyces rugulosus]|uniref:Nascent polypeptide-associated complex subunit alpha-like UBA domain-containing protein n=1 Tax=Talaromyces rugulosus TaxID=121627 RepID=A0A7H8QJL8_TALRU|nr:uncharacterized protein TRUGW13939_00745 [Talaromyces rugulosus]QKX53665.1 hypothetical protein TRUGW13939_00745 [Talaromyces rugulosus]